MASTGAPNSAIKRTFALPVWQLDALREMARAAGTSQTAVLTQAVTAEWQRWRKAQEEAEEWKAAAKDPAFLAYLDAVAGL